jgi:hypothetical protein
VQPLSIVGRRRPAELEDAAERESPFLKPFVSTHKLTERLVMDPEQIQGYVGWAISMLKAVHCYDHTAAVGR